MNVVCIVADTLRRDHCGPYHKNRPLNQCWSKEAPGWVVPTPHMDSLAQRGITFTNCHTGSTPCMPARRDIYTGRIEFLERGWAPLEEDDRDLPREVSGPPNQSLQWSLENDHNISYLISDHFHLWEQGAGNYHMGYSGFDFVRGCESDAYYTDNPDFFCPSSVRLTKNERHWRNVHHIRKNREDYFAHQVFSRSADWIDLNHDNGDFYLHIDSFTPHEPLDPPEELLKMFDPDGYTEEDDYATWPYAPWKDKLTPRQFNNVRARYAGKVVELDQALGLLMEKMDKYDLWKNTIFILTTDHGTFNGDHGRVGKLQTHEFDAKSHIPFIMAHPGGKGETRDQLIQLVDIYPTTLAAMGKEIPENIHGVNLLPLIDDPRAKTRDYAVMGQFGKSVSITDGDWTLHLNTENPENQPLNWYSYYLSKFLFTPLGDFDGEKRPALSLASWEEKTWLSNKKEDPNELTNLAQELPERVITMKKALKDKILAMNLRGHAAEDQMTRLGL